MTENITLYERNGLTGETVETVLTGAEADAWRAQFEIPDEEKQESLRQQRAFAYAAEADPLFFKAQRGEATTDEWTAKVAEIKARFPYPGDNE